MYIQTHTQAPLTAAIVLALLSPILPSPFLPSFSLSLPYFLPSSFPPSPLPPTPTPFPILPTDGSLLSDSFVRLLKFLTTWFSCCACCSSTAATFWMNSAAVGSDSVYVRCECIIYIHVGMVCSVRVWMCVVRSVRYMYTYRRCGAQV